MQRISRIAIEIVVYGRKRSYLGRITWIWWNFSTTCSGQNDNAEVLSKSHRLTPPDLRERAKGRKPACCRKARMQQNADFHEIDRSRRPDRIGISYLVLIPNGTSHSLHRSIKFENEIMCTNGQKLPKSTEKFEK